MRMILILIWSLATAVQAELPDNTYPLRTEPPQDPAQLITMAYQGFLGRTPSESELRIQLSGIDRGITLPLILDSILKSTEAAAHAATVEPERLCAEHELQAQVGTYLLNFLNRRQQQVAAFNPPGSAAATLNYRCRAQCVYQCMNFTHQAWVAMSVSGGTRTETFNQLWEDCRARKARDCSAYNQPRGTLYLAPWWDSRGVFDPSNTNEQQACNHL